MERQPMLVHLLTKAKSHNCASGVSVDQHTPLEEVFIFFDTATYDEIERDVKVQAQHYVKNKKTITMIH